MNRSELLLQFGAVLVLTGWVGTTSPHELLLQPQSATQFHVDINQMSQSGGCLLQYSTPCPPWEDPNSEGVLCGCTGPDDETSCSPAEAEGDDEEDAVIPNAGFPLYYFHGMGFGSSHDVSTVCTTFYTCQSGCLPSLEFLDQYSCNVEQVSEFAGGSLVNDNDTVSCDTWTAQMPPESRMQKQLAFVSGVGLQLFPAE